MADDLDGLFDLLPGLDEKRCPGVRLTDNDPGSDDPNAVLNLLELLGPPPPLREPRVPVRQLDAAAIALYDPLGEEKLRRVLRQLCERLFSCGPFSFLDSAALNFEGNGVYVLCYQGELEVYRAIRSLGSTCPIYIGRARNSIALRLRDHFDTLDRTDLGVENFTFRFVVLPDNYVEFVETNLIDLFQPVWNTYLKGFGEREGDRQTSRRVEQFISRWDTLHAGRTTGSTRQRNREFIEEQARPHVQRGRAMYEKVMSELLGLPTETQPCTQAAGPLPYCSS